MKKFKKQAVEALDSKMALWCTFFNQYFNDELVDSFCEKSAAINRVAKVLEMDNWDRKERDAYEKLKLITHDRILAAEFAQKQSEEWIKNAEKTMEESKRAIEESKKTIETQAKELELAEENVRKAKLEAERKTKLEMAKKLLKASMSVKEVAVFAELSEVNVENL